VSKSIEIIDGEDEDDILAKKLADELAVDEERVRKSGKRIFRVRVVLETDVLVFAKDAEEASDLAEIHWNGFGDQEPFTDYEPISSEAEEVANFSQVEDLRDVLMFVPVIDPKDEIEDEINGLDFTVHEYLRALKVPGEPDESDEDDESEE
jgi:hypothetical protein